MSGGYATQADHQLEVVSKSHIRPNGCVVPRIKMLTEESELNPPKYCGG
jgi:hypothetical protein